MDLTLSPEQEAFRKSVLEIARDVVEPGAAERDREGRFDREVWRTLGRHELLGLPVPEEHGGAGASLLDTVVAGEALGEGGGDGGLMLSLGAHWVIGCVPIWLHGTPEQQQRWLPGLCSGEYIGAWASTEPGAGSDAAGITTRADRQPDGSYVLNGSKVFITNGPVADVCTVLAKTDAGPTAFLVDTTNPGFQVVRDIPKMGCKSSPTAEIALVDCRVDGDTVLGPEGEALWRIAFECFDWERTVMLAATVGGMQRSLDQTVRYVKDREQFGRSISKFQAVQHTVADMKINLEVCRTAVYRAAWLKQEGRPHQVEASIAKALCGRLAHENATHAVQMHGGYGYTTDFEAERALRDAKLTSIGGGTTEIQKMVISRVLLGGG